MTATWREEFTARFHHLNDREVEVWQEIIQREISNLQPGEVLAAVRSLGEDKRQGKLKYSPTVENLISAIIKNRWRISRNIPQPEKCALCGGLGWMPFGTSITTHATYAGEKIMSLGVQRHNSAGWAYATLATPCLCSTGMRQLKAYPENERDEMIALSHRVLDWKKRVTADSPVEDQLCAVDEG